MRLFSLLLGLFALVSPVFLFAPTADAQTVLSIVFPVQGSASFRDDFSDPRSGGRTHQATDILAAKMTPVVAAVDGTITFAPMVQPSYGYMITLRGNNGYTFNYIHLNNDTPGTDDGLGGPDTAYAQGITKGVDVQAGDHIGWVGDSGNAEATAPHLHFEIEDENGMRINPYPSLLAAYATLTFDPELEQQLATSINVDKNISLAQGPVACTSDALIRTPDVSTVYYCGQDGGRYAFQNESTYFSWYADFSDVVVVSSATMASIPLKGVVTYKPGVFMVKLQSVDRVYAVGRNGTLRWIPSPDIATELYGTSWPKKVRDLSDAFFPRYTIGTVVQGS